jgi:hypothetical protein
MKWSRDKNALHRITEDILVATGGMLLGALLLNWLQKKNAPPAQIQK